MDSRGNIKPMPIWESILLLSVISILGVLSFYVVRPLLEQAGLNVYSAYLLSLSSVFIVMIIWSIVAFLAEGNQKSLTAFLIRYRLDNFHLKHLFWSIPLGLIMFLSTVLFSPLISQAISAGLISLPQNIPDYLNPLLQSSVTQLKDQIISQGVLPLIPLVLLINIFGEELFWRGMVFPRQELSHGKNTFIIHGSIWALSHLFQYWLLIPILVGSLALSYVIQRTKNTWVSILAHLLNNSIPFIFMFMIST